MLEAAREACDMLRGESRASLEHDRKLALALVRLIEIVGEAAANVSKETQLNLIDILWRDVIGMRNRVVHAYFDVDLEIVWQTIVDDFPDLIPKLEEAIESFIFCLLVFLEILNSKFSIFNFCATSIKIPALSNYETVESVFVIGYHNNNCNGLPGGSFCQNLL